MTRTQKLTYRLAHERPDAYRIMRRWVWLPWIFLVGLTIQLAVWALDREPPFRLISYTAAPVRPGGVLHIDGIVRRDLGRRCGMVGSRYITDSIGVRYDVASANAMTANALAQLDAAAPGRLLQAHRIPAYITPGPAKMVTTMVYSCNILHDLIRPIPVDVVIAFEVLPP